MMAAQDPSTVQYTNMIPQLTTQMHALQLTTPPVYSSFSFKPINSVMLNCKQLIFIVGNVKHKSLHF